MSVYGGIDVHHCWPPRQMRMKARDAWGRRWRVKAPPESRRGLAGERLVAVILTLT
jgi:hypothetical protein